mgnify:FL=1
MSRFIISILLIFGLLQLNYSQNKIQQIKPEKILYKNTNEGELNLFVYKPSEFDVKKKYSCIVFFHGGGWNSGNPEQFQRQSRYFASRGMVAVSVEYRIRNKHGTSPIQAMEDTKSAIRFIRSNARLLSIDPSRIAAAGGSAGGHLAAVAGNIDLFNNSDEDLTISSKPNLLILYNPVIDFGTRKWLWINNPSDASPIHNISKGSPPTIILTGTNDKIVPVESIMNYKKIMESIGSRCDVILYEGAEHAFFNTGEDFVDTLYRTDVFLKSLEYIDGEPTIR